MKKEYILLFEARNMNFSEILKMLRENRSYTQQRLADALHVTKNSISHYERGISMPDLGTLCAIADIFDVSLDYLLGRSDFNLPNHMLKKKIGKTTSAGKMLESIIKLDNNHSADLIKMLYYIETDNNRTK